MSRRKNCVARPRRRGSWLGAFVLFSSVAFAQSGAERSRVIYVISDTHMGLGRLPGGEWSSWEDFRWSGALASFLERISGDHQQKVDLVIAGDFLEMWQTPADIDCSAPAGKKNYGCSVAEAKEMAMRIIAAHHKDFAALAKFAAQGENCVHVVPGNHDAALMENGPWQPVRAALEARGGCVTRGEQKTSPNGIAEPQGYWVSRSGRVFVEHGHQIGKDANRIAIWPKVAEALDVDTGGAGEEADRSRFVRRPWGETFVQGVFNREESAFPMIDNLSPSSAGARYRLGEEDLAGKAREAAKFVLFNLAETSWRQKFSALGNRDKETPLAPRTEREIAELGRGLGAELVLATLPANDPLRAHIEGGGEEWDRLRLDLDAEAKTLTDEEIVALCDLARQMTGKNPCLPALGDLGALAQGVLSSHRSAVRNHVETLWSNRRGMRLFAYGHTHSFEIPWAASPSGGVALKIANSGAFQRLIDDARLQQIVSEKQKRDPRYRAIDFLASNRLEDLPACYTVVKVQYKGMVPEMSLHAWYAKEADELGPDDPPADFVEPCDPRCPSVGHGCEKE